jgi:hypothetical protein
MDRSGRRWSWFETLRPVTEQEVPPPWRQLRFILPCQSLERVADVLVGHHARDTPAALDLLFYLVVAHYSSAHREKSPAQRVRVGLCSKNGGKQPFSKKIVR